MSFTVYMHKFPNNKVYIGITQVDVTKRWRSDGHGYSSQLVGKAIKKYGWENVEHIIIAENLTKNEACAMEIALIKEYDSTNPDKGYNVATGGDINCGFHFKHTDEAKRKIGEAGKGRVISEAQRRQVSQVHKGKCLSVETRQKLSESIHNKMNDEYKAKISKSIKEKWANGDYDKSIEKMKGRTPWNKGKTKDTDKRLANVSRLIKCRGVSEETRKKISESCKGKPAPNRRPVQCIETGEVFESISSANHAIDKGSVGIALHKGIRAGGYHWRYYEE